MTLLEYKSMSLPYGLKAQFPETNEKGCRKNVIERKFEINQLPNVGDKDINGEKLFIQATGVRIKRQSVNGEYYFSLDKKFFIAKDLKGNYVSGKIVGEYL